jgi:hypothetical protein
LKSEPRKQEEEEEEEKEELILLFSSFRRFFAYFSTLKTEAIRLFEMSVRLRGFTIQE